MNNNKIYTGSGILPIYIYNNIPYFVIVRLTNGIYSDPGGKLEPNTSLLKNATKELYEETCGLIKLEDNKLKKSNYHSIRINYSKDKYYKSYIVVLNSKIDFELYNQNLLECNKFRFNPFSESNKIHLIKLSMINYDILKKNLHLNPRLKLIILSILKKHDNIHNFYNYYIKKIKPLYLKKEITNPISYEYATHKKIQIKNLSSFSISNN
jgi:hypothetical protein